MSIFFEPILDVAKNELMEHMPGAEFASRTAEYINNKAIGIAEKIPVIGPMLKKGAQLFNWGEDQVNALLRGTADDIEKHFGIGPKTKTTPKNVVNDIKDHDFFRENEIDKDGNEIDNQIDFNKAYKAYSDADKQNGAIKAHDILHEHSKDFVRKTLDERIQGRTGPQFNAMKNKLKELNPDGSINMKLFDPIDFKFNDVFDSSTNQELEQLFEESGFDPNSKAEMDLKNKLISDFKEKGKINAEEFKNKLKDEIIKRNDFRAKVKTRMGRQINKNPNLDEFFSKKLRPEQKPLRNFLLGTETSPTSTPEIISGDRPERLELELERKKIKEKFDARNPLISIDKLEEVSKVMTDEEIKELSESFSVLKKLSATDDNILTNQIDLSDKELIQLSEINPFLKEPLKSPPVKTLEALQAQEAQGVGLEESEVSETLEKITSPDGILIKGFDELTEVEKGTFKDILNRVNKRQGIPYQEQELKRALSLGEEAIEEPSLQEITESEFEPTEELKRKTLEDVGVQIDGDPPKVSEFDESKKKSQTFVKQDHFSELQLKTLNDFFDKEENFELFDILEKEVRESWMESIPVDKTKLVTSYSELGGGTFTRFKTFLNDSALTVNEFIDKAESVLLERQKDIWSKSEDFLNKTVSDAFANTEEEINNFTRFIDKPLEEITDGGDLLPPDELARRLDRPPEEILSKYDRMENAYNEFIRKIVKDNPTLEKLLDGVTFKDALFAGAGGGFASAGLVLSSKSREDIQKLKTTVNKALDSIGAPELLKDAINKTLDDMEDVENKQTRQFQETMKQFIREQGELKQLETRKEQALQIFNQPSTSIVTDNEHSNELKKAEKALSEKQIKLQTRIKQLEKQAKLTKQSIERQREKKKRQKFQAELKKRKAKADKELKLKRVAPRIQPNEQLGVIRPQLAGDSMKKPINVNIINRVQSPSHNESVHKVNDGIVQKESKESKMKDTTPSQHRFLRTRKDNQNDNRKRIII